MCAVLSQLVLARAFAHVSAHPSVHDTARELSSECRKSSVDQLTRITLDEVLEFLNSEEREILGNEHCVYGERARGPHRLPSGRARGGRVLLTSFGSRRPDSRLNPAAMCMKAGRSP